MLSSILYSLCKSEETEAEDLEVEYFKLLRSLADDEIDALEDKYKADADAYEEAIDAKIDKINEQADAEIEALRAVEEENLFTDIKV